MTYMLFYFQQRQAQGGAGVSLRRRRTRARGRRPRPPQEGQRHRRLGDRRPHALRHRVQRAKRRVRIRFVMYPELLFHCWHTYKAPA